MSPPGEFLEHLGPSIRVISEASGSELITIVVGYETEDGLRTSFATYRISRSGSVSQVTENDGGFLFRQASLFKSFMAVAMTFIIEKLSKDPDTDDPDTRKRYLCLRNGWDKSFSEVFNTVSKDLKLPTLPGNPSIRHLLIHFNGFPNIDDLLIAPDASFLMTMNDFIQKTVPQYCKKSHARVGDTGLWRDYSNANYLLIGLLIEAVSGMPLAHFLKEKLLNKLGMNRTYVTDTDFQRLSNGANGQPPLATIAQPHIVRSDGTRRAIEINHPRDMAELVVLGGYIHAGDMELFLRAVIEGLPQLFGEESRALYRSKHTLNEDRPDGYKLVGLFLTLDSIWLGSHSLNRLILPDGDLSKCILEFKKKPRDEDLKKLTEKYLNTFYISGSATGCSNTVYFQPQNNFTVIVLTNTSGPLDASDLISRLCLEEFLGVVKPSRLLRPSDCFNASAEVVKKLEIADSVPDTKTADCPNILGTYVNDETGQILNVFDSKDIEGGNGNGVLHITIRTKWKWSQPIRFVRAKKPRSSEQTSFVRAGEAFRMCSIVHDRTPRRSGLPPMSITTPGMGIDHFSSWKNVEFTFQETDGVAYFERKREPFLDKFVRITGA